MIRVAHNHEGWIEDATAFGSIEAEPLGRSPTATPTIASSRGGAWF